jgi:hypothetical protein
MKLLIIKKGGKTPNNQKKKRGRKSMESFMKRAATLRKSHGEMWKTLKLGEEAAIAAGFISDKGNKDPVFCAACGIFFPNKWKITCLPCWGA